MLVIDPHGDALDLALRAQAAGHEVKYYTDLAQKSFTRFIGKGLVERVGDPMRHLCWANLVYLADNQKFLSRIDAFRRDFPDHAVFGPTQAGAALELDRVKGADMLLKHGINIPQIKQCSTYDDAVDYVQRRGKRLVCKPLGDADKALSYASKGPDDMIFMLGKWKREKKLRGKFILQDFIEGKEFGVGVYVGPHGYAGAYEESFEHKKLLARDIGPNTGEMGTVLMFTAKSKLGAKILRPLEEEFVAMGYTGDINLNTIIDEKGEIWPLEFTARAGFPAQQIQTPLWPDDPVQWMYDLVKTGEPPKFKEDVCALGVAITMPPFPYEHAPLELATDFPIFGVTPYNKDKLHPYHMQAGKETEWATAGTYALVVTGTSETISGAKENCYRTVKQLTIPGNPIFRHDIGDRAIEALPELQKHGFALNFH